MYLQSFSLCNAGEKKNSQDYLTRGGKIFIAYLLIVYIVPLLINLVYDSEPIFRLPIQKESVLLSVFLLILVSFLAIITAKYTPTITPKNKSPIKPLPKWITVGISLIAITLGYSIFNADLSQWRYTTSISSNSTVLYASLVQTIMPVLSFWILMTDHQFILSRSKSDIFIKFLVVLGLLFSTNGLISILVTLIFALVFIAPNSMLGFLFNSTEVKRNKKFLRYLGLAMILPFIFTPLFMAGLYAKSGVNEGYSFKEKTLAYTGLNYLINRHSVHLSSLAASIEDGPSHSDLTIPIDTAIFRFNLLTGLDSTPQKPEVSTFSRRALIQFADFRYINPTGGSSPGLLASFTMVLPLPLAIISVFFATLFIIKFSDFILCRQPPLSFIGALIFAYIPFRMVTDSPFDLLIPGPVSFVLLSIFLLSLRREKIYS